jgi:valyl-tRNA synthetase
VYLIIYFCSLYELQISDQIFILVLTAFMTIPAQFDAKTIEDKWYDYWMKTIIFILSQIIEPIYHSNSSPKCYWVLHMGMLNNNDSRCLDKKSTSQGI